jgi:hypothetical protein
MLNHVKPLVLLVRYPKKLPVATAFRFRGSPKPWLWPWWCPETEAASGRCPDGQRPQSSVLSRWFYDTNIMIYYTYSSNNYGL